MVVRPCLFHSLFQVRQYKLPAKRGLVDRTRLNLASGGLPCKKAMAGIACRIETDAQQMSLRNFVETQRADLIETKNESAVAIAERYRSTSVTRGYR